MAADREMREMILRSVPQQKPFRFIDEILELDDNHITGDYRFREDEYFYRGHFPDQPITPGVILIETMAQTGVVALGLYLTLRQNGVAVEGPPKLTTLFTFADGVEFSGIVVPGERVIIHGEKVYFRKGSLKTKVSMERESGEMVCFGLLAGTGVTLHDK